jgi:hypothetical protein
MVKSMEQPAAAEVQQLAEKLAETQVAKAPLKELAEQVPGPLPALQLV